MTISHIGKKQNIKIITRGRTVKAEQWQAWRKEGKSNTAIASILGISPSMARIIARKFHAAGCPDPQYGKTRPGLLIKVDTGTEEGAYILGILGVPAQKLNRITT